MNTLKALMILKSEFEGVFFPDENGKTKSLMQLEETLNSIIMSPEVRRFVDAQERKEVETVESFYKKEFLDQRKNIKKYKTKKTANS